jgi:UDP-N-acetylmuramate dehydrogenase
MSIEKIIQKNILLAPLTTYKIGGPAKYFIEVKTKDELKECLAWADEKKEKVYILGGGSNILVPDDGVNGLVICLKNDMVKVMGDRVECGAGATLSRVNSLAISNNLSGLEWTVGIPRASIGGAVRGNAGAFKVEMKDIIETVEIFNVKRSEFEILSNGMCEFVYRSSLFKKKSEYIIWSATLKMIKADKKEIEEKIQKTIEFRNEKYPKLPSAGSVFKNIAPEELKINNEVLFEREFKDKIGRDGKISAGLIIEMLGLKGKTIGGIKISLEHANHIVNTGKGTSNDVVTLISLVKEKARNVFKIQLQEEISYFGFDV